MPVPCKPLFICLLLAGAAGAHADTGYKCIDAQGRIAFQDRPCPADQQTSSFHYDAAAARAAANEMSKAASTPSAPLPAIDSPPAAMPERVPVPPLFRCARGDGGEAYHSDSAETTPYTVPLGVLGYPQRGLGEVYGGRDGVGVSAPSGRPPRVLAPSAANEIAAMSVWVEDDCRELPAGEACRIRARQLDTLRSKLRRAFKDERTLLEPRERLLVQQLAGC